MWSNATRAQGCVCEIWEGLCGQISDSEVQCATENDLVVMGNVRDASKRGRAVDMFPRRPFQGSYAATLKVCGTCTDSLLRVAVPWLCVTPQVPYTCTGHPPSQGGMTLNFFVQDILVQKGHAIAAHQVCRERDLTMQEDPASFCTTYLLLRC